MTECSSNPLLEAIQTADLAEIERLASTGVDLNVYDSFGEPALFKAVDAAQFAEGEADREFRLSVVRRLVDLGADLHALDDEGSGILIGPILGQQTELVEWLLNRGVDPNHGCGEPWETVYDLASFDYRFEAWIAPSLSPLDPPDTMADEDSYLSWLDNEAEKQGRLRPVIPLLLRRFDALTGEEMAAKLGGSSDQQIKWAKVGWQLD